MTEQFNEQSLPPMGDQLPEIDEIAEGEELETIQDVEPEEQLPF